MLKSCGLPAMLRHTEPIRSSHCGLTAISHSASRRGLQWTGAGAHTGEHARFSTLRQPLVASAFMMAFSCMSAGCPAGPTARPVTTQSNYVGNFTRYTQAGFQWSLRSAFSLPSRADWLTPFRAAQPALRRLSELVSSNNCAQTGCCACRADWLTPFRVPQPASTQSPDTAWLACQQPPVASEPQVLSSGTGSEAAQAHVGTRAAVADQLRASSSQAPDFPVCDAGSAAAAGGSIKACEAAENRQGLSTKGELAQTPDMGLARSKTRSVTAS